LNGGLLIGAAARNTAIAEHHVVRTRYPALSRAILTGASGQIRNMATLGGNLLQRTRCGYFYDQAARCNKREPGAGCDAVGGFNRNHAILGGSPDCAATHPSDMCVALAALDAIIHLDGPDGARTVALNAFYRLPGDRPDIETVLAPGELITAIELPALPMAARSVYRKVCDRSSYAFALVSAGPTTRPGCRPLWRFRPSRRGARRRIATDGRHRCCPDRGASRFGCRTFEIGRQRLAARGA
jgi:xanthine dehydrogenase YagS FAD-binding subunit